MIATARYSRIDTDGKLYVDCSECERGGLGGGMTKCLCGWNIAIGMQNGCFHGTLRSGITVGNTNKT